MKQILPHDILYLSLRDRFSKIHYPHKIYDKNTKFKDWRGKGIIGTFAGEGYTKNITKVDLLKVIALEEGKTCGQVAINWVLRQPGLTTALVGVKNPVQMEENLKSIGWQPSKENCEKIEQIFSSAD